MRAALLMETSRSGSVTTKTYSHERCVTSFNSRSTPTNHVQPFSAQQSKSQSSSSVSPPMRGLTHTGHPCPVLTTSAPVSAETSRPSFQTPAAELSKRPLQAGSSIPTGESGPAGVTGVAQTGGDAGDAPWSEQVPFTADRGRPRADAGCHQEGIAVLGDDGPAAAVVTAQVAKGMAWRAQKRAMFDGGGV